MLVRHQGKEPAIGPGSFVAANALICGDVRIGRNCRIMYGASLVAEGGSIEIGDDCIVLENAVLRSTERHDLRIGRQVLVGPQAHVVGCTVGDKVFIATGAAVFHGAVLGSGAEVRIHGVVHIKTVLADHATVPIAWVAVGDPAVILPPERHDEIWAVQKPLDFPRQVYGVERGPDIMPAMIASMQAMLAGHQEDQVLDDGAAGGQT